MALKTSKALRIAAASGVGYRAALNADPSTHGAKLIYYGGTVPANADASIGSATPLCEFLNGSAGLSLGAAADIGSDTVVMSINSGETWQGTALASGMPTFFRFTEAADSPTDATGTYCRVQGTAGLGGGFDLTVRGALVESTTYPCLSFDVTIPSY
jgi:hypothetical protein